MTAGGSHPAGHAATILVAVAALLAVLGHTAASAVAALAAVLVPQALILARGSASFVEGLGRTAGRAVALVLLTPVYALVFLPAALVNRLLGRTALSTPGWHQQRDAGGRPRRTFATDRPRHAANGPSWRTAIALVAVGAIGATVVPGWFESEDVDVPDLLRDGSDFNAMESPAMAGAAWADEAAVEFGEAVAAGSTYTPYVGASLLDHRGRYVNIVDRQRRTYRPASGEGPPVDVWFFGGSTMFGFSAQRDLHTIPSELVRLAEADGLTVHARNYGAPGYVNFQETILFSQLLVAGERPDVAVFYDGINDLAVQLQHAFAGLGPLGALSDISAFTMRTLLAERLTGSAEPPVPAVEPGPAGSPPTVDDIVDATIDTYLRGVELARTVGERYGVEVVHLWQPTMFTKDPLVEGETDLLEPLRLDEFRFSALADIAGALRRELPQGVVDLSDAWDGTTTPILNDQVHTNELGARLVAQAVYEVVAPKVRTAAR